MKKKHHLTIRLSDKIWTHLEKTSEIENRSKSFILTRFIDQAEEILSDAFMKTKQDKEQQKKASL